MTSSPRSSQDRKPVVYVREDLAATISFNEDTAEERPALLTVGRNELIGTMWCNTCVGIAWSLDEDRVFLAHINGWRFVRSATQAPGLVDTSTDWLNNC